MNNKEASVVLNELKGRLEKGERVRISPEDALRYAQALTVATSSAKPKNIPKPKDDDTPADKPKAEEAPKKKRGIFGSKKS